MSAESSRLQIQGGTSKSELSTQYNEHRENLFVCMEEIESTSKQAITISKTGAIRRMLKDSKFVFWPTAFHKIMPAMFPSRIYDEIIPKFQNFQGEDPHSPLS